MSASSQPRRGRTRLVLLSLTIAFAGAGLTTPHAAAPDLSSAAGQQPETIQSGDGIWTAIAQAALPPSRPGDTSPQSYRAFRANRPALIAVLASAPMEFTPAATSAPAILTLPMPDGSFQRFRVVESPIVSPPSETIRTYSAAGIDDPTASARVDWGTHGFHGTILSTSDTVYIDPWTSGDTEHYISYYKAQRPRDPNDRCLLTEAENQVASLGRGPVPAVVSNGTLLRTYRFAVALTGEFTAFFRQAGDSDAQAQQRAFDAMVANVNRMNVVYERDMSIRLQVLNRLDIVYTNAATDPYTGGDTFTMLNENIQNMQNVLGPAAFDIGHVLSGIGGGGVAGLGAACNDSTFGGTFPGAVKARGATGSTNPTGQSFSVDLWAHEVGHQLAASHTFNGTVGSCSGGNRSEATSFEPGSGSTIMAYGGTCAQGGTTQNLTLATADNFHVRSLEQMTAHADGTGPQGVPACGTTVATSNALPTVNAGTNATIPRGTPFALTAVASDANGDALTYSWEQYDAGGAGGASPPDTDADGVARPIFRAYLPGTSATRTFPRLEFILNNANVPPTTYTCEFGQTCLTGEILPAMNRVMNFQAVVRDNRASGGAVASAQVALTVNAAAGPFRVTSPNTGAFDEGTIRVVGGSLQTITWDVANTSAAPISAANVRISLSTDGGTTFPTVIVASTPNDGTEQLVIPNIPTTTARVKIEAVGHVFFDISDVNFTITAGAGCTFTINPTSQSVLAAGATHTSAVTTQAGCAWTAASNDPAFITVTGGATGIGSGTATYTVAANAGAARNGTLTIATQTLTVNQAAGGGGCTFTINPTTQAVVAGGGTHTAAVTTQAACAWTAVSNNTTFITVTGGATGTGNGTVTYTVTPNGTPAVRNGSLLIATQTLTVNQATGGGGNNPPTVTITTPAASPATATSPFITLAGTAADDVAVANVTWVSNRGFNGTATGTTNWSAEVPLLAGANIFTVTATDGPGAQGTATKTVNVTVFTYFLAEGATGPFFDLDILLGNPNAVDAPATANFLRDDGVVVPITGILAANSRTTIRVDDIPGLENTAVSAVITSTNALPILVERTMRWNASGYGAHTEKAIAGTSLNWFFAEGSQGFFDTYLLLVNPNAAPNVTTVNFLTEDIGVVTRTVTVPANSRFNVHAGSIPQLINKSFGINVAFTLPGAAERAMYFGTPLFNGGHESAGVTQAANLWFHAEGATGPYFSTFILVTNPNAAPATVTMRFLPATGGPVSKVKVIPANTRLTVNVATEDPSLANIAVATEVSSNIPVISERAMYWPGAFASWFEAHNSFGVNSAATKWGLAEGRVGNPPGTPAGQTPNFETYILLANPGSTAATVTINYLRTTGAPIVKTYTVEANSRFNVQVNSAVPELVNTTFSTVISSTVPIAVERAMYSNASGVIWAAGTNATAIRIP